MKVVGKIIGISELSVKVLLMDQDITLRDILICEYNDKTYQFEVIEINDDIANLIPFSRVNGLKKGLDEAD